MIPSPAPVLSLGLPDFPGSHSLMSKSALGGINAHAMVPILRQRESIERALMRTESRCAVTFSNYNVYGEPMLSVESRRRIAVNYSVSQRSSDGNVITEHE
ncbi:hypothetical protein CEXT_592581 [Caerostris extrusa]|uniref:Uncharacterized protein n=1 Tax=Caerostris extrusa TaxID=172846 RepID=A0AAV4U866_CAEEX|nr:hypothetical protein CEXT_592581 [Caerostris extrusa]